MRKYEHGMRWAFWRWTSVCKNGAEYLRRLHLLKTPWFSVMLHWIRHPDPDAVLHDHPVGFVSFVLRGSYVEQIPDPVEPVAKLYTKGPNYLPIIFWRCYSHRVRWFNFKRATDKHYISHVEPKTLTLVFAGPKRREWGYSPVPETFIPWQEFQQ